MDVAGQGRLNRIGKTDAHGVFEAEGLNASGLGAFRVSADGRLLAGNACFTNWLALAADEPLDCSLDTLIVGFDAERWRARWNKLLSGARSTSFLAQFKCGDGSLMPVEMRLTRLDASRELTEAFGLLIPIGDRLLEEGVHQVQQIVLEAIAVGQPLQRVMDLLCRRIEALAPDVICSVLGVDEAGRLRPQAAPSLPDAYTAAIDGVPIGPCCGSCGTAAWRGESVVVSDIASDPLWDIARPIALAHGLAACWSTPFRVCGGRVVGTFALYYRKPRGADPFHRRLIDACVHLCTLAFEHEANHAEIRRLAFNDSLTGLPNRLLLRDRVEQALIRAERERSPLAMLFLDLDRLKAINDSLGHAAGDSLLQGVAKRLVAHVRESDTVSRIGGDEFVIVLADCDAAAAQRVADKIRDSLSQPLEIEGIGFVTSASIGISLYPSDARDFDSLLKNADIAMYQAKSDGRNCARLYESLRLHE